MRLSHLSAACLAVAFAGPLAGCGGDPNEEAAQCPRPHLLRDAARLSRYDGRGTDVSDLVLGVRLTDVQGACSGRLGVKQQGAHAHVVMVVTRGPVATSPSADVTYKVGVVRNGQILGEHTYVQHVTFPANVSTLQVTGQEIPFTLPTGKDTTGQNYNLYFWLDLTPAELAANRRAG